MTSIELLAFVVLPLLIAAGGAAVAYFYRAGSDHRLHPGE